MDKQQIGQVVAQRREQLQLTQEDLAEMALVTTKTIYMIERGKGNPALDTLQRVLQVLGLEMTVAIKKVDQ